MTDSERSTFMAALDEFEDALINACTSAPGTPGMSVRLANVRQKRRDLVAYFDRATRLGRDAA